jgi:hypothetical protein
LASVFILALLTPIFLEISVFYVDLAAIIVLRILVLTVMLINIVMRINVIKIVILPAYNMIMVKPMAKMCVYYALMAVIHVQV